MSDTAPAPGDERLTIEQLAQQTGMTVRNIRNHQTRGLLPPPQVRARTGYYGRQHVERLRLIQELQAEGLKLSAIERLVSDDTLADRLIGLRRAITTPVESERSEIVTLAELEARFGPVGNNPSSLLKAQKLGALVNLGDGTFEVPNPSLLRAAEEVVGQGVPLPAALAAMARVKNDAESAARTFVKLFMEELWKPFDAAGQPEADWPAITRAIERLRPLAVQALLGVFKPALADEIEKAFGKALEDQARRKP